MKRPKPTKQLIIELVGNNQGLISSVYNGLNETPLNNFYPHLDLDEAIAFSASSWKNRKKKSEIFKEVVESGNIYDIFKEANNIGFPWLNKYKDVSERLIEKHDKLNPFKGRCLEERLGQVSPEAVERLRDQLMEDVNQYVFECQYRDAKIARGGDNHKLNILTFQNFYPGKGKIVPAYAGEIVKMLSNKVYNPLDDSVKERLEEQKPGEQLELF
jgi:hypothetical protein